MIKLPYLILLLLLCSCVSIRYNETTPLEGKYISKYDSLLPNIYSEYILELKPNYVFYLDIKVHGSNPFCKGNWRIDKSQKLIYLDCDSTQDISEMLSSGYMNKRNRMIKVINFDSLEMDNIILHRVE